MNAISEREHGEIEAANASGNTPVVFIHGLWVLPTSWANSVDLFEQAGYAPLTPDWPDDPASVEESRESQPAGLLVVGGQHKSAHLGAGTVRRLVRSSSSPLLVVNHHADDDAST